MINLKNLLNDMDQPEVEKVAEITIEDLENTLYALEKLASADREVDTMAKLAVLIDMGIEREVLAGLYTASKKARKKAIKLLNNIEIKEETANILNKATKKKKATQQTIKETAKIKSGKKDFSSLKWPAIAGVGMLGSFHLGGKMSDESRKAGRRKVAHKFYNSGKESAGGR